MIFLVENKEETRYWKV